MEQQKNCERMKGNEQINKFIEFGKITNQEFHSRAIIC